MERAKPGSPRMVAIKRLVCVALSLLVFDLICITSFSFSALTLFTGHGVLIPCL